MKLLLLSLALLAYATVAAADASNQVLIYFANETHLNEDAQRNYDALIEILTSDTNGVGPAIAKDLASDFYSFPNEVKEEVKKLTSAAHDRTKLNIMVFTNAMSTKGRYLLHKSGAKGFFKRTFSVEPSGNYVSRSHPNSRPSTMRSALKAAVTHFDPDEYSFSLITKSHAGRSYMLTPRITVRHEELSPQDILDVANGRSDDTGTPTWMKGAVTTTSEYIDLLRDAGERLKMRFDLVFAEGCKGRAGLPRDRPLPTNIQTLIVPSVNLDYTTLDYGVAFTSDVDPIANITEQAAKRVPNDVATLKPAKRSLWEIALWWLPLFIVLGAFLLRRVLVKRWVARAR